ncbi:MAG: universal stress protein [Armatimonadota bacterium]
MFERAIVAVDPTQDPQALLQYATKLHADGGLQLVLVIVLPTGSPRFAEARHMPEVRAAMHRVGEQLVEEAVARLPDELAGSAAVASGPQELPRVIHDLIHQYEADLVALQYPVESPVHEWLGGGLLLRTIELTQSSVLVVEEGVPPPSGEKAIYCYSGSEASRRALPTAIEFAKLFDLTLEVVHADRDLEAGRAAMEAVRELDLPGEVDLELVEQGQRETVSDALRRHVSAVGDPMVVALREALGGTQIPTGVLRLRPKALLTLAPAEGDS